MTVFVAGGGVDVVVAAALTEQQQLFHLLVSTDSSIEVGGLALEIDRLIVDIVLRKRP